MLARAGAAFSQLDVDIVLQLADGPHEREVEAVAFLVTGVVFVGKRFPRASRLVGQGVAVQPHLRIFFGGCVAGAAAVRPHGEQNVARVGGEADAVLKPVFGRDFVEVCVVELDRAGVPHGGVDVGLVPAHVELGHGGLRIGQTFVRVVVVDRVGEPGGIDLDLVVFAVVDRAVRSPCGRLFADCELDFTERLFRFEVSRCGHCERDDHEKSHNQRGEFLHGIPPR